MPATDTNQSQGGSDSSTTARGPTKATSTRTEQASTVTSTTESQPETSETITAGSKTRSVQKELIGMTVTFTLKVTNTPPPKSLA